MMMERRGVMRWLVVVVVMLMATSAAWAYFTNRLDVGSAKQFQVDTNGNVSTSGSLQASRVGAVSATATPLTLNANYYGKTLFYSPASAGTINLPANGAPKGTTIEIIVLTAQNVTVAAATLDTLIVDGDLAADSVSFSTAAHQIGSQLRVISNGTNWVAVNVGSTTMTIAT